MIYNSIDNKKIKELKKLHDKKYRNELFLVEGEHLVSEAYKAGLLKEVFTNNKKLDIDVLLNEMNDKVAAYLSNLSTPSNIIGVCYKKENILEGKRIVYLDNVQDPGNLGTIIRSCVAFNVDTLILSNCVDLYNDKVIRATQGLLFHLNIIEGDKNTLVHLREKDFKLYGTKLSGNELKSIAKCDKFVIIMGNEGKGVSENILSLCDDFICIKMNSLCESLNVGVATSIILYEMGDL